MRFPPKMATVCYVLLLSAITNFVTAEQYKDGDPVPLYVNKVGPYFNPHETYHYYQLPVCRPEKVEHRSLTLGEILDGDRMAVSMYDIKFKEDVTDGKLCTVELKEEDIEQLREAIEDLYYFEFIL
uniref:Transmembrane 9 superfamily member n=1 Tax=Saccoglossus kowalevskii TaxID=10224 RepID=A0ABM0MUD4_SACKO